MFHVIARVAFVVSAALSISGAQLSAALSLAPPFTDHMVLQRDVAAAVWGSAEPNAAVTVQFAGQTKTSNADPSGRWQLSLDPLPANAESRVLRVSSQSADLSSPVDDVILRDVLVGEVWLAAGQSNMEFALGKAAGAQESVPKANQPLIRLLHRRGAARGGRTVYSPESIQRLDAKRFCTGQWQVATPEVARDFSAVAWFFGLNLADELAVPIGLIDVSLGGTPAEAWIRREALAATPLLGDVVRGNWLENTHTGEWCRERARYNLARALKSGERIPGDDLGPNHSFKPTFMWESAVAPLVPLALRGVIWYQGESNAESPGRVRQHGELFPLLIRDWRLQWKRTDLPFLFVQLPGMKRPDWPEFRETQRRVLQSVPGTGMAVTMDLGHPTVYGKRITFSGPLFRSVTSSRSGLAVEFDHGDGLKTSDGKPVVGFEVAGADGKFVPASARVEGGRVVLTPPKNSVTREVRYGWSPFPDPPLNLVNGAGLPASPFSTVAPPRIIRVACVGDSITYGYGLKNRAQEKYPVQLGRILGAGYGVREFGNSGRGILQQSMRGAEKRAFIFMPEQTAAVQFEPDIVICNLGINDIMDWEKYGRREFVRDYRALVSSYKDLSTQPRIILWQPLAPLFSGHAFHEDPRVAAINDAIAAVARLEQLEVVDMASPFSDVTNASALFPDHIHPNAEGARRIARVLATHILERGLSFGKAQDR
jgi:sialate O-acetylesterase